jgi:predicted Zn finger-like uncharacterized protein
MKITCGSCAAKYTVSDDKVHGKTVKVKCRKCGAVIVVSSSGEVQTSGGDAPGGGGGDASYTVSVSDTDQRTMTIPEMIAAYNEGVIDAETYVWAEGMDDWLPLKDVDAIVDALHDAASGGGGGDLGATVAMSDSPYQAPASYPPAGGASDHFGASTVAMSGGGLSSGGGYDAPPAARQSDGTTGGFFSGSGGAGLASAPAVGGGGAENSAIFSLNMLTAKVDDPVPAPTSGTTEDSGLIDLKALAAGMGGDEGGIAAQPADGGLFPLGAPMAAGPSMATPSIPAPAAGSGGNRSIVIGLGLAVVVLGAALVFIMVRDSGPPPAPTTVAQPEPAPTPTPTPEPTAATPTTAVADASAAPSATASAKVAVGRPIGPPKPGGAPIAQPKSGPKGPPSPPPPPAKGKCGCAADDLMCHMRCSQK